MAEKNKTSKNNKSTYSTENIANHFLLSSFWKRLSAWLIDEIILVLIVFAIIYVSPEAIPTSIEGITQEFLNKVVQFSVLLSLLYFTVLEGKTGQTIGKKAISIKILKEEGEKISYSTALLRRVGMIVPLFNLIDGPSILFTSKNQRIFDIIASTIVINQKYEEEAIEYIENGKISNKLKNEMEKLPIENTEDVDKEKTLEKLKEKKQDLKEKFENEEISEKNYNEIMSRYRNRIEKLEKETSKQE